MELLTSACHLVMLYICARFREIISNGISYGADTNDEPLTDRRTDGWTDTQNFGGYNIIPCHFFEAGHKNPKAADLE